MVSGNATALKPIALRMAKTFCFGHSDCKRVKQAHIVQPLSSFHKALGHNSFDCAWSTLSIKALFAQNTCIDSCNSTV